MAGRFLTRWKTRRVFGKIKQIIKIPHLIGMQHDSYQKLHALHFQASCIPSEGFS